MSKRLALAAALILAPLAAAGCAPISSNQGFQVVDVSPGDIKADVDTKQSVNDKLGTPSMTSTMDPNTWYYVSQNTSRVAFYQPRVVTRTVYSIAFDPASQKVTKITKYGIEQGKVFAFNSRETPTRGRELSVIEQLLGNLGQSVPFLDDASNSGVPGTRPGD